ncbi:MAG: ThiF family adenylyltransferase, partial [Candidatus Micrarchaeota archaeon]|nr:ThiF family adenylyltransferase [Candidatus Micrarchaeota archaeon]
ILFDRDRFELSNFNRQMLANDYGVDVPKVEIAVAHARAINKDAKIENYYKMFEDADSDKIENCEVVIDCTDNVESHLLIATVCRKLKKPMILCTASFAVGMVTVIEKTDLAKMFQLPKNKQLLKKYNTCTSVLSTATAVSGSLAAQQAINFILKRNSIKAPEVLFFDLFAKEPFYIKKLK